MRSRTRSERSVTIRLCKWHITGVKSDSDDPSSDKRLKSKVELHDMRAAKVPDCKSLGAISLTEKIVFTWVTHFLELTPCRCEFEVNCRSYE